MDLEKIKAKIEEIHIQEMVKRLRKEKGFVAAAAYYQNRKASGTQETADAVKRICGLSS